MESSKDDGRWKIHIRWTLSRKGSFFSGKRTHEWKQILWEKNVSFTKWQFPQVFSQLPAAVASADTSSGWFCCIQSCHVLMRKPLPGVWRNSDWWSKAAPGWCFPDWISQLHPAVLDDRFQEVELVFFEREWTWQFENENDNTMSMPYFWSEVVNKGNRKHPDFSLVTHFLSGCAMTGWWLTSTIRCHKVAVTVYCFVKHRLWHQTCQYPRHLQNLGVCMCNSMV